jgi:hypothetical protein
VGGSFRATSAIELLNRITPFISEVARALPVDEFTVSRTVPAEGPVPGVWKYRTAV